MVCVTLGMQLVFLVKHYLACMLMVSSILPTFRANKYLNQIYILLSQHTKLGSISKREGKDLLSVNYNDCPTLLSNFRREIISSYVTIETLRSFYLSKELLRGHGYFNLGSLLCVIYHETIKISHECAFWGQPCNLPSLYTYSTWNIYLNWNSSTHSPFKLFYLYCLDVLYQE